jgi:subfamily B ATP-binding cassette protein HlyB/CyaB
MLQQAEMTCDEVLWLLGSLSGLFRIPFDAALIAQAYPPPHTVATLQEAARSIGLRTGTCGRARINWPKLPLPAIAFLRPLPAAQATDVAVSGAARPAPAAATAEIPSPPRAILVVGADADRLLYFRPGGEAPETLRIVDVASRLAPDVMLVAKDSAGAGREDIAGFTTEKKKFGFRWFIPELLKHQRIWRDVLLASLAIQLVGLSVPVFTQVIIDKVIIHQTQSTLAVLGVALVMFVLFTSGMTWLRQYLVLHTGNRIDAVLGSQVFRHLLRLPLPYFEQRPTGTLVARLHGVETIREFVSGAAVTLVLDLPFLLIFLAVMFAYSDASGSAVRTPWTRSFASTTCAERAKSSIRAAFSRATRTGLCRRSSPLRGSC